MRLLPVPALLLAVSSAAQAQLSDPLLNAGFEDREQHLDHGLLLQPTPNSWRVMYGVGFPQPSGNFRAVEIETGRYVSIQLTGPGSDVPPFGGGFGQTRLETSEAPSVNGGPLALSISTLRGDFRSSPGCRVYTNTIQVTLLLAQCPIDSQQTYWLNIANIALPYTVPAPSLCADPLSCGLLLAARTFF